MATFAPISQNELSGQIRANFCPRLFSHLGQAVFNEQNVHTQKYQFLAHLSRRLKGELIVYRSIRRPWVRASVRASVNIFKLEYLRNQWANRNQILSEASLGWGLIALGFGPGRIGTLVSMATDSSHRVINVVSTLAPSFFIGSSSYLQVTRTSITSRTSSKFGQIGLMTAELAALERLEKSP